jgi:hypothetical protein
LPRNLANGLLARSRERSQCFPAASSRFRCWKRYQRQFPMKTFWNTFVPFRFLRRTNTVKALCCSRYRKGAFYSIPLYEPSLPSSRKAFYLPAILVLLFSTSSAHELNAFIFFRKQFIPLSSRSVRIFVPMRFSSFFPSARATLKRPLLTHSREQLMRTDPRPFCGRASSESSSVNYLCPPAPAPHSLLIRFIPG